MKTSTKRKERKIMNKFMKIAKDRVYASTMGALAVDLLCEGKTNRVVGYRHGAFVDFDIDEALAMKKEIPEYEYQIAKNLSI